MAADETESHSASKSAAQAGAELASAAGVGSAGEDSTSGASGGAQRGTSQRPSQRPSTRPGGAASLIGTTLSGRYRIERLLGEGGMGAVYQAEHTHMRKRLAVKVLHPEMSRLPEVVARFEREAMAAAHIDHPNVATATDFGKLEDGSFFLVLEFVEGKSLREAINRGALDLGRALHITRQIAAALQRAHALGIVHRDLKPENVMLVERDGDADFVKVLDFGIAKVPVGELAKSEAGAEKGPVLTQLGMVYGTPEYMAPEQALGQNVDPRADLYALGVMTFEMLTQSRPYDHESKVALLGMHVTAPIPRPSERAPSANIPPEVDTIVVKLLAKETGDRYQDAKELIDTATSVLASLSAQGRIDTRFGPQVAPPSSQVSLPGSQVALGGPVPSARGAALAQTEVLPTAGAGGSAYAMVALRLRTLTLMGLSGRSLAMVLGAGVGGVLFLVVVFVMILTHGTTEGPQPTQADGATVATASATTPAPPPVKPEVEARIREAIGLVEKGDYGTAIAQLGELEQANPARSDIRRALVDAYIATKRTDEAMEEAGRALSLDPNLAKDKALRLHLRNVALTGGKDAEDQAFALLESAMGSEGPDVLYDIAYIVTGYPKPAARAKSVLRKPEVRARATDELKLALEVREVSQKSACELRKYFERAEEIGDWRTAHVLKGYTATSGCGFLGRRDCWPCLHGDGSLGRAIRAIEERNAARKD